MPKLRPTFRLPLSILGVVALLLALGVLAPHAEGVVVRAPAPTAALGAAALPIGQRPAAAAAA
ncbi:MAG TPA: hypothetical protein VIP79_00655, partial [Gemmatimonadaceae bacterium]